MSLFNVSTLHSSLVNNAYYIDCPEWGNKIYTTAQNYSREQYEVIIAQKESEIERLKSEIENLNQENEVMVESFRISTDMLLERLKDLESVNFAGERPQTAQVLSRIHGNYSEELNRPAIMNDFRTQDVLNLENGDDEGLSEENVCTNCRELVHPREFAKHTIQWIRNSTKWKICQETIPKDHKKQHLLEWRKADRMIKAIQNDDDDTMLKMFNHGAKAETLLDKKKKQKPLHFIAMNGSVRWLLILMGKGLEELSPQDHEGDTPLNMAIRNNKTVIAKSLIELGTEIETKDASMRTPLMNACLYGNLEIVKVLLDAGANWKATNAINDTWITLAQKSKNTDIVMLLVEKGASLRPMSSSTKGREPAIASLNIKKKPL